MVENDDVSAGEADAAAAGSPSRQSDKSDSTATAASSKSEVERPSEPVEEPTEPVATPAEPVPDVPDPVSDSDAEAVPEAVSTAESDAEPPAEDQSPAKDEPVAEDEPPTEAEPPAEDEPVAEDEPPTEAEPVAEVAADPEPAVAEDTTPAPEPAAAEPVPAVEEPRPAVEEPAAVVEDEPAVAEPAVFEVPMPLEPPPAVGALAEALSRLRAAIGGAAYPLVMPSADEARRIGAALVSQLDDYLLPRLARLDAPLLVVVGGSTGAGKSTLVNSLVRAPVSAAGVLRPTTRSPVLVSNASDLPWFRKGELLPGLTRIHESSPDPRTLQLVSAPALGPGLAFLDAPDIDSVVDRNRQLAAQLLAAADLWLFVTTAARYADAVPWELLTTARLRGTVIALVLNRVPAGAAGEVSAHLGEMLSAHDMSAAPLFVLPETTLDGQGLLTEDVVRPLHDWFAQLAADGNARAAVVRQTLDGALAALRTAVSGLADAADDQATAAHALDERVTLAYRTAKRTVEQGLQDGRLLRGEVLARWQEFVGTGEFVRALESKVGLLRDRIIAAITGRPAPGRNLQAALESQLVTLIRGVAADAAEQAYSAWHAHPAGAALLEPALQKPSADLPERADRAVRDWQRWVLELVRSEAGDKRFVARGAAYAVNGVGLAVMIAVFTSTAFIPTGAEVAVGAGTTIAAQKVLEAIFGDQAIRTLAARAREELLKRVDALLDAEAARYSDRTLSAGLAMEPGAQLRRAAEDVENAREELALTAAVTAVLPRSQGGTR
jgi:hypothetical protein